MNYLLYIGDALIMAQTQVLCWEMQNRGESIDLISNPSQAELMQKQFKEKKIALEGSKKKISLKNMVVKIRKFSIRD